MTVRLIFWIALSVCLAQCGCSGAPEGPATALATGTVTYKGAPVVGAVVVFRPDGADESVRPAESSTNDAGVFSMQTSLGKGNYREGVVPGNYLVEIRKIEPPADFTGPPRSLLPAKYASARTSGLKAPVEQEKVNEFKFDLTD